MRSVLRGMMNNTKDYPTNMEFEDDRVTAVLQLHPRQKAKIMTGKLRWVLNPYNNEQRVLEFEKVHGDWDSISWIKCTKRVTLCPKPASSALPTATRVDITLAVRDICNKKRKRAQRKACAVFKKSVLTGSCARCEKDGVQVQMDHGKIPFETILSDFVKQRGISVMTIPVLRQAHSLHWEVSDPALSTAFQEYHDSLVEYQSLCIPCHQVKTNHEATQRKKKKL